MSKINVVETESVFYNVVCEHPDDSSRSYVFCVENTEEINPWVMEDEVFYKSVREEIEKKVNPYHYWHEVKITAVFYIGDDIYQTEI